MKLKYYLRGLGLGIIFTSIILAVAYSQNKGLTTDSEVMKRASELGMISTETESSGLFDQEGTENMGTETEDEGQTSQSEESSQQAGDQTSQLAQTTQPEAQSSQQEEVPQQPGTSDNQSEQITPQESQLVDSQQSAEQTVQSGADEREYIVIEIVRGEVCRQIAEDLQAHGLVDDAESFRLYMQQKNYDNSIRVGSVPIKKGATYEEIAIALTTKQ